MRKPELVEPREALVLALEHRDRRSASGDEAARRMHGDRLEGAHRAPAARIEYVAMAHAVDLDEALVVAARGDGPGAHGKRGEQGVLAAWTANADAPRRSIGLGAEDGEIAREIHERARHAQLVQHQ